MAVRYRRTERQRGSDSKRMTETDVETQGWKDTDGKRQKRQRMDTSNRKIQRQEKATEESRRMTGRQRRTEKLNKTEGGVKSDRDSQTDRIRVKQGEAVRQITDGGRDRER